MPDTVGLHISFDEHGREIEVLDVTPVAKDEYRIEETPLFNPELALGDIIRVKERQGIAYYVETVHKSGYRKYSLLLSREAADSHEIVQLTREVAAHDGRWEKLFGGLLVIHMPEQALFDPEAALARIRLRYNI